MRNKEARIPNISSIYTASGSPIHKILEPRFDGVNTCLVVTGEENIQDRMEAEAPSTDINYMLHRLSLGDTSVLSSKRPMYGDFTGLPSDPIEALNLVHQSEYAFAQLSADDKAKYNNDWRRWFADLLSGRDNLSEKLSSVVPNSDVEKEGADSVVEKDSGGSN